MKNIILSHQLYYLKKVVLKKNDCFIAICLEITYYLTDKKVLY